MVVAVIAWLSWPSRVVVSAGSVPRPARAHPPSDRLVVHIVEEHHEALPIWHSVEGSISVLHVVSSFILFLSPSFAW